MNGSIFVDTNVLVYTRDASQANKQMRAAEWVSYLWQTGNAFQQQPAKEGNSP